MRGILISTKLNGFAVKCGFVYLYQITYCTIFETDNVIRLNCSPSTTNWVKGESVPESGTEEKCVTKMVRKN